MGAILGSIATKMLSQKVMIAILVKLGDWLVGRSENKMILVVVLMLFLMLEI